MSNEQRATSNEHSIESTRASICAASATRSHAAGHGHTARPESTVAAEKGFSFCVPKSPRRCHAEQKEVRQIRPRYSHSVLIGGDESTHPPNINSAERAITQQPDGQRAVLRYCTGTGTGTGTGTALEIRMWSSRAVSEMIEAHAQAQSKESARPWLGSPGGWMWFMPASASRVSQSWRN
jgi:hypothetical protein